MDSLKKAALLAFLVGVAQCTLQGKAVAYDGIDFNEGSISSATAGPGAILISTNGRFLLDGIILATTSVNGAFVEFRDTFTANTNYEPAHAPKLTVFFSSSSVIGNSTFTGGQVLYFARPIRFYRGIATYGSNCNTNTLCYSVLYRKVSD